MLKRTERVFSNPNQTKLYYKKYQVGGKRQAHYSKTNFSWEKMDELLNSLLDSNIPEFPKEVKLKLPSIKKIELPKLEKVNG